MEGLGDCGATDDRPPFDDANAMAGGGQVGGTDQAIVARAQDEDVLRQRGFSGFGVCVRRSE